MVPLAFSQNSNNFSRPKARRLIGILSKRLKGAFKYLITNFIRHHLITNTYFIHWTGSQAIQLFRERVSNKTKCQNSNYFSRPIVSFAAVFWGELCVTSQKTPAKETTRPKAWLPIPTLYTEPDLKLYTAHTHRRTMPGHPWLKYFFAIIQEKKSPCKLQ